jgi:predicted nucleotidyltransferase
MLASLLFGAYRRRVLGLLLLHPEETYHVREIARLTDTAAGTLHKELARLAQAGLLTRERIGNQLRYAANRQCPVFEELASILRKTSGLADIVLDALTGVSKRIDVALIFGSVARGEERTGSDVDVLMIGSIGFADAVKAMHPAQEKIGREINPVVMSPEEFRRKQEAGDGFVREILAKEKIFLIGDEDELGKLGSHQTAAES